jgi:hypothetical protein
VTTQWTKDPEWNTLLDTCTRYASESERDPNMRKHAQGWRNRRWDHLDTGQQFDRKLGRWAK